MKAIGQGLVGRTGCNEKGEHGDEKSGEVREEMGCVGHYSERACDVSSDEFNGHEGKEETADFYKFCNCGAVLDFKLGLEIAFSEMVVDVFLFERRAK